MKISTAALKFINQHYGSAGDPAADGIDDLVGRIGAQLGAVEETIDFGARFEGVIIAKVISCDDHPQADRLHVCKIDDGGVAEGVERDENGYVQVVCGAPNVREGLLVAWLPPGATVPDTYGTQDPFVLEARSLRGVVSNGMLASQRELSLGDSHEGILEVDIDAAPGTSFAEAYHLTGDVIIDMENKMFTHRPDCFGWLGIAREIEGIYHRPYKSPEWYRMDADLDAVAAVDIAELPLKIDNQLPELVPRFSAVTIKSVTVKQSPVWLQADLARVGLRSINNIVDYTNFFMLETGQPLHAYDYDKVKKLSGSDSYATLTIRFPQEGEKLTLLNGKEITPRSEAIMIATDTTLIGVGGVMGGVDTEVDENTRNVIIECANFDMYSVRRTSMAHGLFTDAVTRFNKGQSPLQTRAVLAKITNEICRYAGGEVSAAVDDKHLPEGVEARGNLHPPVHLSRGFINARLGFDLSADEMAGLLRNVEFMVDVNGDDLTVTAPFWRTDIALPEDVVEEVGRLYGYDHLPLELPVRDLTPAPKDQYLELKRRIAEALSAAGANETLGYSFVHGDLLKKTGQNTDEAFGLSNALSPDLQYMRLSLTPSLLDKIHPNIKAGYNEFALYEINKVHSKTVRQDDGLPKELPRLAFVYTAADKTAAAAHDGAAYYQARKYLLHLLGSLDTDAAGKLAFEPITGDEQDSAARFYQPGRAATIKLNGDIVGRIGEYAPSVRRALKLPAFTAGFELGLEPLMKHLGLGAQYVRLPRFPKVEQDLCLRVPATTPYADVFSFVWAHIDEHRPGHTYRTLGPVDIYQPADSPDYKHITLRLGLASYERTLTDSEVNALLDRVATAAGEALHAERV